MDEMLRKQDILDAIMAKIDELEKTNTSADVILGLAAAMSTVKQMQAAPVTPAEKVGHWRDTGSGQECSECGEIQYGYDSFRKYCANCGAKMQEVEE